MKTIPKYNLKENITNINNVKKPVCSTDECICPFCGEDPDIWDYADLSDNYYGDIAEEWYTAVCCNCGKELAFYRTSPYEYEFDYYTNEDGFELNPNNYYLFSKDEPPTEVQDIAGHENAENIKKPTNITAHDICPCCNNRIVLDDAEWVDSYDEWDYIREIYEVSCPSCGVKLMFSKTASLDYEFRYFCDEDYEKLDENQYYEFDNNYLPLHLSRNDQVEVDSLLSGVDLIEEDCNNLKSKINEHNKLNEALDRVDIPNIKKPLNITNSGICPFCGENPDIWENADYEDTDYNGDYQTEYYRTTCTECGAELYFSRSAYIQFDFDWFLDTEYRELSLDTYYMFDKNYPPHKLTKDEEIEFINWTSGVDLLDDEDDLETRINNIKQREEEN